MMVGRKWGRAKLDSQEFVEDQVCELLDLERGGQGSRNLRRGARRRRQKERGDRRGEGEKGRILYLDDLFTCMKHCDYDAVSLLCYHLPALLR